MRAPLYHFTSRESADAILSTGFQGETVWLSPDANTTMGEDARSALLEIVLDLSDTELRAYEQVVREDVWDETANDFVQDPSVPISYIWYDVPAAIVNCRGRVRLVTADERARLMLGA